MGSFRFLGYSLFIIAFEQCYKAVDGIGLGQGPPRDGDGWWWSGNGWNFGVYVLAPAMHSTGKGTETHMYTQPESRKVHTSVYIYIYSIIYITYVFFVFFLNF